VPCSGSGSRPVVVDRSSPTNSTSVMVIGSWSLGTVGDASGSLVNVEVVLFARQEMHWVYTTRGCM
jgi:hypothetical protein